jgi:hypothetical protein
MRVGYRAVIGSGGRVVCVGDNGQITAVETMNRVPNGHVVMESLGWIEDTLQGKHELITFHNNRLTYRKEGRFVFVDITCTTG